MRRFHRQARAFTLIELVVVLGVIALLLTILLPAMIGGRNAARDLKCRARLRNVAVAFINFGSETGIGSRGDSDRLGDRRFKIEDFQESVYRIHEFWDGGAAERQAVNPAMQPMMCPAGTSFLERRSGMPCSSGAIGPKKNVSEGFNKRLETRTRIINGQPYGAPAYLTDKILQFPDVPLLLDVDGQAAASREVLPYYTAPPVSAKDRRPDFFASGQLWFPSLRHRDRSNVAFVGGHVLASGQPTNEAWWRWDYQPEP